MRKTLILLMICAAGCSKPDLQKASHVATYETENFKKVSIIKIRGCEYLCFGVYGYNVYAHCGDCSNPIHKYNIGDTLR